MTKAYKKFLKLDETKFNAGEYIIMIEDKVVKHGKKLKKLMKEVRQKYPNQRPFIAKIPSEGVMILQTKQDGDF